MSISSHIVASLWTAAAIEMSTDEEVTKSERIKMEVIVITVVIIISLSIIILLLLLVVVVMLPVDTTMAVMCHVLVVCCSLLLLAPLFLERIIKKSLNYNFFNFNFLIMLLLSNSSHEITIDHQNRWVLQFALQPNYVVK